MKKSNNPKSIANSGYLRGNFYNRDLQWADTHSNPHVKYHKNGNIASIRYWRYYQSENNYKYTSIFDYRLKGPSVQEFYSNGSLALEKYTDYYGRLHREDGPAYIKYNQDSSVILEDYYLDGGIIGTNLKIYDQQILKDYLQNLEIMK